MPVGWPLHLDGAVKQRCLHRTTTVSSSNYVGRMDLTPIACPGVAAFNFLPAEAVIHGGTIQAGMKTLMYIPCCIGPGLFKLGSDASHLTLYGFDV